MSTNSPYNWYCTVLVMLKDQLVGTSSVVERHVFSFSAFLAFLRTVLQ